MVPVGKATLGRIMDVLGQPIDERGPVDQTHTVKGWVKSLRNSKKFSLTALKDSA